MTTKNDITGDSIHSKASGEAYRNGYDAIWGKKDKPKSEAMEALDEMMDSVLMVTAEEFEREYMLDPYVSPCCRTCFPERVSFQVITCLECGSKRCDGAYDCNAPCGRAMEKKDV